MHVVYNTIKTKCVHILWICYFRAPSSSHLSRATSPLCHKSHLKLSDEFQLHVIRRIIALTTNVVNVDCHRGRRFLRIWYVKLDVLLLH